MSPKVAPLPTQVVEALEHVGVWAQRVQSGKIMPYGRIFDLGSAGMPHVVVLAPVYGWLYAKSTTGLNDNQVAWYTRARDLGVPVHIVHSTDDARRVVERWKNDKKAMLEPISLEVQV